LIPADHPNKKHIEYFYDMFLKNKKKFSTISNDPHSNDYWNTFNTISSKAIDITDQLFGKSDLLTGKNRDEFYVKEAINALLDFEHSGDMLYMSYNEIKLLATLGDAAAILILPVMKTVEELR
jgi:hypothetical protein